MFNKISKYSIASLAFALGSMAYAYPVDKHLSIALNVDTLSIDPEINNTVSIPGNRVELLGAYGGGYGLIEYTKHPATDLNYPLVDDYTRLEVGLSLDRQNNLRIGLQGIPKWDMIGYRVRGLHNLNYGLQVEPWLGFMKSIKKRPSPLFHSSTTQLGVTVNKQLFKGTRLRFGYETNLFNKHTSLDYGFIGISIGLQ